MPYEDFSRPLTPPKRSSVGRRILVAILLLLLLAAAAAAWLVWRGTVRLSLSMDGDRTAVAAKAPVAGPVHSPLAASSQAAAPQLSPPPVAGTLDSRIALLENRLSRIDLQASAASGNAARAEGLLIAFAARRTIDRGAQLGYLEDQLQLRFADAQPNAVRAIVDGARDRVTLDGLLAQLDALGPALAGAASGEDTWTRVKREFAGLFVIRHEAQPGVRPEERMLRARLMLASGKVDEAIGEISRLPGAAAAQKWIAAAQRYGEVQRALDLIETTAMLEPRELNDSKGRDVQQPSPLAAPPSPPTASPSPLPSPGVSL